MPNHIQSNLKFLCDEKRIREILESVMYDPSGENEERGFGTIDFERIIPMPQELDIESGSRTTQAIELYLTSVNPRISYFGSDKMDSSEFDSLVAKINENKRYPYNSALPEHEIADTIKYSHQKAELLDLGQKAVNNCINYGAPTWYEWRVQNWGTKWNSYSNSYDGGDTICLQTAWSAPKEVIKALSAQNPDVAMELEYADEDIGANCGRLLYVGGEITEEYHPESETEAVEFAASVWDYDIKDTLGLYKNATGDRYIYPSEDDFELISILGKDALFTNERLTDSNIAAGLYVYHLRDADTGDAFATLEPRVEVNFGGSVITKEPIDFGEEGYIDISGEENSPNFCGEEISMLSFMEGTYEQYEQEEEEEEGVTLC